MMQIFRASLVLTLFCLGWGGNFDNELSSTSLDIRSFKFSYSLSTTLQLLRLYLCRVDILPGGKKKCQSNCISFRFFSSQQHASLLLFLFSSTVPARFCRCVVVAVASRGFYFGCSNSSVRRPGSPPAGSTREVIIALVYSVNVCQMDAAPGCRCVCWENKSQESAEKKNPFISFTFGDRRSSRVPFPER